MPNFACDFTPTLKQAIGWGNQMLSGQRSLFKKVDDVMLELRGKAESFAMSSRVFNPMYDALQKASVFKSKRSRELEAIARKMDMGETENVLAAVIDPAAGKFHNLSPANLANAKKLRAHWSSILEESFGLSKADAERFITQDFAKVRAAGGDMARLAGMRNSYPKTFHPLLNELIGGGINTTQNNAYAVGWNLIHSAEKVKFLQPAAAQAQQVVNSFKKIPGMDPKDVEFASKIGHEFIDHAVHQRDAQRTFFSKTIEGTVNKMNKVLGKDAIDIDSDTMNRWAANMASWYAGSAMAFRPALAARNMTQVLLPMSKVGYGRGGRALKMVYGKDSAKNRTHAANAIGVPEGGEAPIYFSEGEGGPLASRFGRFIKDLQNKGMIPFRWADRVNNRYTTFLMGEMAILEEAPALLRKNNPISWEQFMFRTGLKGSHKIDQVRIKSLLLGVEQPNVRQAAKEFGKELVADTQFIYEGLNAPMAFRGTAGRMFGQFGTWPLSFTEFMWQNVAGAGDKAWTQKFLGNYAIQKAALSGVGLASGVDTSSWNFSNPLTFQGGPWYQALRDVTILGTSQNEFERRQARGVVNRMFGLTGTPWTTVFNPLGSVTQDTIQAIQALDTPGSPVEAALLGFGFNLRSNRPATRR